MGDYHEDTPDSEDDEGVLARVLREAENGEGESTEREQSEASYIDPLIDGQSEQSQNEQEHNDSSFSRQLYIERNSTPMFSQPSGDRLSLGRFSTMSPSKPCFTPTDRSLPSRDVTNETLDDAYVAFILYCNPSVPLNCDTTELRKAFRLPPKSDGKTFNVHDLLQLIMRLEQKEIKTWTKLAIELGVERTPDQSTQKVQQYAVRLKRWMHAMHIDAFFEYCLGKAHSYYTQIPAVTQNGPEEIRDGVPFEEDLALRALHPENRPKRGRRKAEDKNDENTDKELPASKRQHMDPATPSTADAVGVMEFHNPLFPGPHSAITPTTDTDAMDRYLGEAITPDPWSATAAAIGVGGSSTPVNGQQYRWRTFSKEATTPHPTSAPVLSLDTPTDEAVTPTITTPMSAKPRPRRRHGPAVSSAWPSSGNPLTGKLRGRPPSNRSIRDGPFSTFPVNPFGKNNITIDLGAGATGTPTSTPVVTSNPQQFPATHNLRPQGLHLQVPPRQPSTVKIATPIAPRYNGKNPFKSDGVLEELERAFAANVLQGAISNLNIESAKSIAKKAIADLIGRLGGTSSAPELAMLSTLKVLLGCELNSSELFKNFKIQRISGSEDSKVEASSPDQGRYRISWLFKLGSLKGDFTQVVLLGSGSNCVVEGTNGAENEEDVDSDCSGRTAAEKRNSNRGSGGNCGGSRADTDINGNDFDWRKKYFEMEKRLREKEDEIATIKRKVLHAVM
ncbi:ARS binding protein 2-domain-containing protein [Kalaharituber pfeilii]|nr:ARS binding protein 2-domain-containing protein [Kalaharituber pfeilii]